jgi:hypothetical protein
LRLPPGCPAVTLLHVAAAERGLSDSDASNEDD